MYSIGKNLFSIEKIALFLMFLASMNLLGKYFYFLYIVFLLLAVVFRKIKVDWMTLLLIGFSGFYIMSAWYTGNSAIVIIKQLAFPISYLIGLNLFSFQKYDEINKEKICHKQIFSSVTCIAMGSFIHYILNMVTNNESINRNTVDYWSGERMAATGQAALAILALCLFITILFIDIRLKWKIFSTIGILLICIYNFVLSGRMLILIAFIIFIEVLLFSSKSNSYKVIIRRLLILLATVILIILAFVNNWFGLADLLNESNLFRRFEDMDFFADSRFYFKTQYVSLMLKYPFGGGKIHHIVGNYAHDIILDAYNDLGIVGAALLCIFLVVSAIQIYRFVRNKSFSLESRMLILSVSTALFIIFFSEPIFSGMPWMFCSFCFFQGILTFINRYEL